MRINKMRIAVILTAAVLMISGCGAGNGSQAESGGTTPETSAELSAETGSQKDDQENNKKDGQENNQEEEKKDSQSDTQKNSQVASADETISQVQVVEEGMVPVYGAELKDGTYAVTVDSSSSMFRIEECQLTVKDGSMSAVMTMGGTGYLKLYMGTGTEAVKAAEDQFIPYVENAEGAYTFEIPVEALDMGIDCSAFSKSKEKWYDRVLVFRADSLPADAFAAEKFVTAESLNLEDGLYTAEVVLEGGSGRASVESPASIRVEDGKIFATIVWGSANYDYMKVKDEKIEWKGTEGNSTFEIPVDGFDWKMSVIADTIAMSTPHEISYTLTFQSASIKKAE